MGSALDSLLSQSLFPASGCIAMARVWLHLLQALEVLNNATVQNSCWVQLIGRVVQELKKFRGAY